MIEMPQLQRVVSHNEEIILAPYLSSRAQNVLFLSDFRQSVLVNENLNFSKEFFIFISISKLKFEKFLIQYLSSMLEVRSKKVSDLICELTIYKVVIFVGF